MNTFLIIANLFVLVGIFMLIRINFQTLQELWELTRQSSAESSLCIKELGSFGSIINNAIDVLQKEKNSIDTLISEIKISQSCSTKKNKKS